MLWRLLRTDLRRNRVVSLVLFAIVAVASLLACTSAVLLSRTAVALESFWADSRPPDIVQMHAGPLNPEDITAWARTQPGIADTDVMETLPVPTARLTIAGKNQADSVLEPALVTSPERFDLLLDEHGNRVAPSPGEVWLPVYYEAENLAKEGDTVTLEVGGTPQLLTVAGFARDAQMNPSMVTSKRMVVNESDFEAARAHLEPEYLIEFRLKEGASLQEVKDAYVHAGLPARGVMVDSTIFALMNALSALLLAIVATLIAGLLIVIALLALRFAFLAAFHTDMAEIATLKAIGAPIGKLKGLFILKYAALTAAGALAGLLASFPLGTLASRGVLMYIGKPHFHVALVAAPVGVAALGTLAIVASCWLLMRRIGTMSAAEALRTGTTRPRIRHAPRWRLARTRLTVPDFLGVRGALNPQNLLLIAVIALSAFAIIVPANIAATFANPHFATYLGVGSADLRIDVRENAESPASLLSRLANDPAVTETAHLTTGRFEAQNPEGKWESVLVEVGDHATFPLTYQEGAAPATASEISLSVNEAKELGASVGETVTLRGDGEVRRLRISGIYQDITNGGMTAKAAFAAPTKPLTELVYVRLAPGEDANAVAARLSHEFPGARVTHMADYASQTMGGAIAQLRTVTWIAAAIALGQTFLIVALFVVLLIARSGRELASLTALGMRNTALTRMHMVQLASVGIVGVAAGVALASLATQPLFRLVMGQMGAPGISLMPNPWVAWLLVPAAVFACVLLATRTSTLRLHTLALRD